MKNLMLLKNVKRVNINNDASDPNSGNDGGNSGNTGYEMGSSSHQSSSFRGSK